MKLITTEAEAVGTVSWQLKNNYKLKLYDCNNINAEITSSILQPSALDLQIFLGLRPQT